MKTIIAAVVAAKIAIAVLAPSAALADANCKCSRKYEKDGVCKGTETCQPLPPAPSK